MAPAAARMAGAVALGGKGYLIGADILSSVAEMSWSPVGDRGLAWRSALLADGAPWPDTIPANFRSVSPEGVIPTLDPGSLAVPPRGESRRAAIKARRPFSETPDGTMSVGTLRASLVIAHGTLRRFFPYFGTVGDGIDDRLVEVLGDTIDPNDRLAHRRRLGRIGNVLSDRHMFAGVLDTTGLIAGYLPVNFAEAGDRPVVLRSAIDGFDPGDTVVAIDGVPVEDLQAGWLTWHGGATDGYRLDVVDREIHYLLEDQRFTLVDPDGVEEEIQVTPALAEDWTALATSWHLRGNGTLDDLGYPNLAYLNLTSEVTTSMDQVEELLATAASSSGLVVDMRGYPGVNHYPILAALCPDGYSSPVFRVPTWTGPERFEMVEEQTTYHGNADAYGGRIVLLVSPVTVSAAENFAQMLVGAGRVEQVVGSASSAGTNGNITGMPLPGGYFLSFTWMEVLNPDRSLFHGRGILADQVVEPTAADFRDGRDPVLEAAAAYLGH